MKKIKLISDILTHLLEMQDKYKKYECNKMQQVCNGLSKMTKNELYALIDILIAIRIER
jgi:hypothetical protein